MTDCTALVARLEAATGPDPHLDAEIEAAIKGALIPSHRCRYDVGFPGAVRTEDRPGTPWYSAPSYTGSVDAALTLVPDGHRWLLDKRPSAYFRRDGYRAEVYREAHYYRSDRSDVPMHWGPTPALALCLAALRARQSREEERDAG